MRYNPEHKHDTRDRIIAAAAELLPHRGFEAVTIDEIMAQAGLTRGAFYGHFGSKADLVAAAIEAALMAAVDAAAPDLLPADAARVNGAAPARDAAPPGAAGEGEADRGWSLVRLAMDAAAADATVRAAFTRSLERIARQLARDMPPGGSDPYCRAVAALTMLAGASALAHAVTDTDLLGEIRHACRKVVRYSLGRACAAP
jgi:TetR/AcrR family transcriptional repressor of nem operon